MAADRRIIIGTHVSPQKYVTKTIPLKASSSRSIAAVEGTLENIDHDRDAYTKSTSEVASSTYDKYIIDSAVGKSLGGKSSSPAHVEITPAQGTLSGDGWTSMAHPQMFWEMYDGTDTNVDAVWETVDGGQGIYWDGTLSPASGGTQILPSQTGAILYCYIKNVGSTVAYVSADGSTYPIKLSAGAAISFRGDGTNLLGNEIKVKAASTTYIEFVAAI